MNYGKGLNKNMGGKYSIHARNYKDKVWMIGLFTDNLLQAIFTKFRRKAPSFSYGDIRRPLLISL